MANKFRIGDIVVINPDCNKLPKWIKNGVRPSQKRRIKGLWYYPTQSHTLYTLGDNGRGLDISFYNFRANMLKTYKMKISTKRKKGVTDNKPMPCQNNYNDNLVALPPLNGELYTQNTKPFNSNLSKSLSNLSQI